MKSIISKTMGLVAIAATLLSFSPNFGGEGFEIYLNNKLIVQRYGSDINAVNNLQLNESSSNDKLTIKYHHCGRVGKNRIVTIKDGKDKVVKEWRFADTNNSVAEMSCSVKEILGLKKSNGVLKLCYSSTELPNGRELASIIIGNNSVAKK